MLYVQQSLGPGEEIQASAQFHWIYTARAIFWIVLGVGAGLALGYGAIWWMVTSDIRETYVDLPPEQYNLAWHKIVGDRGGYLSLLWSISPLLRLIILGCFLLGLFLYAHLMIIKATTEIAVTNERVIYKKGLVARHVGEIGIDRIEGVSVDQSVCGRIWGYGTIIIRGMGVGEVVLPDLIAEPIAFRKTIQEAKSLGDMAKTAPKAQHEDF